jgi:ABC-type nitrate/sulfonate/bicarbonate transport system substrate-binding protein
MTANLKAGHLDGFCVGEPWNSVAVESGIGWCAAVSAELEPGHPEKVLMVRRDFAEERAEEHLALVAALLEACEFCDAPQNRDTLIDWLARPEYVGAPGTTLRRGIYSEFDFGNSCVRAVPEFNVFYRHHANEPSAAKAVWVLKRFAERAGTEGAAPDFALGRRVFRMDLFENAAALRATKRSTHENQNPPKNELTLA